MLETLFILPAAYLLGSIPFGLLLVMLAGHGDVRNIGSGSIGATNVLRVGKKYLALLTLLLDGGKGTLAVLMAEYLMPGAGPFAGLAALLGHLFPVWLRFKGGKGIATSGGIFLALAWPVSLTALFIWLFVATAFRFSSLAALVAVATAPLLAWLYGYNDQIWLIITVAALVIIKHESNIRRLIAGTEPRIGEKSGQNATPTP